MVPVDERSLLVLLLVMSRVSGLFLSAPFLSNRSVPAKVKALLILLLSALMAPLVEVSPGLAFDWTLLPQIGFEVLVGLVIGYIFLSVVLAASMAGQAIDFQLGFALAQMIDPVQGRSSTIISRLYFMIATVLFLTCGGQYLLVKTLVGSFSALPAGAMSLPSALSANALQVFSEMVLMAIRVGAPVIGALFVADVAFGIVARGVPQLNIFVIGFPAKVMLGLVAVMVTLPLTLRLLQGLFNNIESFLVRIA